MQFFFTPAIMLLFHSNGYAQECSTDSFEPNNNNQDAAILTSGESISAHSCLYDDDYYAIELESNSVVSIQTTSIIATADLDLYLLSTDGSTELAFSLSDTSNESIEHFFIPDAGTYYIRTSLYSDTSGEGSGTPYEMSVDITTANACLEDPYEDNDSWNNTTEIAQANGTMIDNLSICPEDEDWFQFQLMEHEQITVTIDFEQDNGDVDITLKDINNNILASSDTTENQEQITYLPLEQGVYKLQVKLFSENDADLGNAYSLHVQTEIVNPCGEDDYDPNETIEDAQSLSAGSHNLVSCDADWFSIEATEGLSIDLSLLFSHIDGDLELNLYDKDGVELSSSATSNDNESLSYPASYTGLYYVEVSLVSTLQVANPYTLNYEQNEVAQPSSEPTSEPTSEPSTEPSSEPSSCSNIPLWELSLLGIFCSLMVAASRKRSE